MTRCYVSLRPPVAVGDAVAEVRGDDDRVRWSDPDDYHVTLRFYPDVDRDRLVEALRTFRFPPIEVVGGPAARAMFDQVVAVPIGGADEIVTAVVEATRSLAPKPSPFRGHLTVGYFRDGAERAFVPRPVEIGWVATSMIVVESIPVGGRYDHGDLAEVAFAI